MRRRIAKVRAKVTLREIRLTKLERKKIGGENEVVSSVMSQNGKVWRGVDERKREIGSVGCKRISVCVGRGGEVRQ